MKYQVFKALYAVKDRETQFEIVPGKIVMLVKIIDQQNPCAFIRTAEMEKGQSVPISLDVFKFAFERV